MALSTAPTPGDAFENSRLLGVYCSSLVWVNMRYCTVPPSQIMFLNNTTNNIIIFINCLLKGWPLAWRNQRRLRLWIARTVLQQVSSQSSSSSSSSSSSWLLLTIILLINMIIIFSIIPIFIRSLSCNCDSEHNDWLRDAGEVGEDFL